MRHLQALGEARMLDQMPRLTMHRNRDLRSRQPVHLGQLVARGMAGDMDEGVLLGDHLDPFADQLIVHAVQCALVARDDLG
jgi:hypothetical protein